MTVIVAVDFSTTVYVNLSKHPNSCSAVLADKSIAEIYHQIAVEGNWLNSYRLLYNKFTLFGAALYYVKASPWTYLYLQYVRLYVWTSWFDLCVATDVEGLKTRTASN